MIEAGPASLPQVRKLDFLLQRKIIAGAAILIFAAFVLIPLARSLMTSPVPPAPSLAAGTFRPTADQLAQLQITPVGFGSAAGTVSAIGTISVDENRETPILLPYSGQVKDVFVQAGQHVSKGQRLFRIASFDFVDARNGFFSATAQRATAVAQLKLAEENAKRQAAIYQTAGGALKDNRQAQADLVAAQSAMRTADAALAAARDKLALLGSMSGEARHRGSGDAETTYQAPVAGTIVTRDVAPGQYVSAGGDKPVMSIADLGRVWLVAELAEGDIATVHLGDMVDVTTPAYPGRTFHAVVDNVGAALDATAHRLRVRATVANADLALKPGMFASFAIRRPRAAAAVMVPTRAVIHEGDTARVWVAGSRGLLVVRQVIVTDSLNGWDRIGSGLRPGDRIVTAGAIFVNEAGLGA